MIGKKNFMLAMCFFAGFKATHAQTSSDGRTGNIISTAVPFLLVAPDARSGAMGETGAATTPDISSTHWNPSKLAFLNDSYGFSVSYSPWMQKFVPDINMAYLNGYYKLDDRNVLGASLRYFSYGDIQMTGEQSQDLGVYNPNELAFDATLARSFGNNFSLGLSARYIYSNLSSGFVNGANQNIAATAFAADISGYYRSDKKPFAGKEATYSAGLNISNIGTKIQHTEGGPKDFLPTNMRLGGALTYHADELSDLTFTIDANKLLVPTLPNSTKSVPAAIFGSFSDAPGGFSEELQELNFGFGAEYMYNKQFAVRVGYFYESPEKGNRNYLTLGAGLKYNIMNIDMAYIAASTQKSPLAQTLRFTLAFNFAEVAAAVKK
ncbi:type IX secretion system outer membrane channel protein PorV [Pseudopedobacter beijingensis]|uniref:Type IX secretion system outer membrane channel protein PorV n=1 Tax=Pseudopedobacter beijingensis TaxID=1207056 RepID=A0ABW4I8L8_9SPHI